MPETILIARELFFQPVVQPAIVTWNRLEGRSRKKDFDRSLKAEVRDPLWMICRQWQFGECRAEDAGSAMKAKVQLDTGRIDRYSPIGEPARAYDDRIPLEVRVEREPVPMTLATRVQIGRHWSKLLGSMWDEEVVQAAYLEKYSIDPPTDAERAARLNSDHKALAYHSAVAGRVVDGEQLLDDINSGEHETFINGLVIPDSKKGALRANAAKLSAWFARLYSTPEQEEKVPWRPSRLEYRFTCGAPSGTAPNGQAVLLAEEYPGGHLDWYAFDIDRRQEFRMNDPDRAALARVEHHDPISFLPAPIEYGGMPDVRWWKFEDRKTDFGEIRASTSDLALLMLAEFALIYGNDWSLVPYDLKVGSLARVRGIVVTDVFGVRTFIRRAASRDDEWWHNWNMYNLHDPSATGVDPHLLLAPAIGHRQEGKPIETVTLTRDEMANMVFAIEEVIPGEIGTGTSGAEAAAALDIHLRKKFEDERGAAVEETPARIRYVAGTTVPENWIPFLPVQISAETGQIRLQRGRMARVLPGLDSAPDPEKVSDTVAPRGDILRVSPDHEPLQPYYIHEEEVPRAGTKVTRSFQRTRWYDGRVFTWLGRKKTVGRGEGESGLRFDQISPLQSKEARPATPDDPGAPGDIGTTDSTGTPNS